MNISYGTEIKTNIIIWSIIFLLVETEKVAVNSFDDCTVTEQITCTIQGMLDKVWGYLEITW
jgi:hypothetical protein